MRKGNVIFEVNIILMIFILILLAMSRYYELFRDHVSVLLLCTYLLYIVAALTIIKIVKCQKGIMSKIAIFSLVMFAMIINFIGRDMFSNWKNHVIYSSNELSIVARVNKSVTGNRCDICICSNGLVMKKVGEPLALPSGYDPIEKHYYVIVADEQYVTIKIKCSKDSNSYEEVMIKK